MKMLGGLQCFSIPKCQLRLVIFFISLNLVVSRFTRVSGCNLTSRSQNLPEAHLS
jgi:hypothetical protein